jgi:hypothetical protein
MAPVSTSPRKEGEGKTRDRSWTAGVGELWRPIPSLPGSSKKEQEEKKEEEIVEEDVFKTPNRASRKKRNFDKVPHSRHSLTPPSSASIDKHLFKGHRRSISNVVTSSWRQEIFDSVSTPTKLDSSFTASRSDSEICEWMCLALGTLVH